VWQLLGAVKTEFGKFGQVLAKTKKKLQEAGHTIDQAEIRSRAIVRKLKNVQEVSLAETVGLIEEDQEKGQDFSPDKGLTQK
jgi:DNA recombination protein RmuC